MTPSSEAIELAIKLSMLPPRLKRQVRKSLEAIRETGNYYGVAPMLRDIIARKRTRPPPRV